jgi:hypothetical protein
MVLKTSDFSTVIQKSPGGSETAIAQTYNPIWHFQLSYEQLFNDLRNPAYSFSELDTLMGFVLSMKGQYDYFVIDDPEDDTVVNQQLQLVNDGFGSYYSPIQRNKGGQFFEDVTDLNPLNMSGLVVKANGVTKTVGTDFTIVGPGLGIPGYSFAGLVIAWTAVTSGYWTASHAYTLNQTILDPAGHIQKATTAGTSGTSFPIFNDAGSTTTDGTVTWTDQSVSAGPTGPITASFSFFFRVRFEKDTQDFEKFLAGLYTIGGGEGRNGSGFVNLVTRRAPPTS